jgi:hypothetical protein
LLAGGETALEVDDDLVPLARRLLAPLDGERPPEELASVLDGLVEDSRQGPCAGLPTSDESGSAGR